MTGGLIGTTGNFSGAVNGSTGTFTGLMDLSGAAAGQVSFPATQNASGGANVLDDYEEGTWTPSLGGNTSYTVQTGGYVKIGRHVTVWGNLIINTLGTGSSNTVSGFPFSSQMASSGWVNWSLTAVSVTGLQLWINASATSAQFYGVTGTATSATVQNVMTSGTGVYFTVSYYTQA